MKCCATQTGAVISKLLEMLCLHNAEVGVLFYRNVCASVYLHVHMWVVLKIHHYAFIFVCGICPRRYVYVEEHDL